MTNVEGRECSSIANDGLERWILQERVRATDFLLRNASAPGAAPGAIVASPSQKNPNYYSHWVRDSGIAVAAILSLYRSAQIPELRQEYFDLLMSFADFSRTIQHAAVHNGKGLGLPKFTIEGAPDMTDLALPQDDGPAIRAIELTRLAFILLKEDKWDLVRDKLYDAKLPTHSVIKTDLEYISHNWRKTCFDCWEEVRGHHFFTRMLQRKALVEGAVLARALGDSQAARWYLEQAKSLGCELRLHWDPQNHFIVATRNRQDEATGRRSGLDSSVVIATLGGYSDDDFHVNVVYPVDHEQVLATVTALEKVFESIYPINDPSRRIPGIAMGRFPEDDYDGYRNNSIGNPWMSLTIGFAMYYYKLAKRYQSLKRIVFSPTSLPFFDRLQPRNTCVPPYKHLRSGDPRFDEIVDALRRKGDAFLERVRYHINPDGSMSEEMNRVTGFQQGARHLSLNYAHPPPPGV